MASGLPGVDVSSFQGKPAAWRAAAGPIAWAGVKITELLPGRRYVNPDAADDWAWLGQQGHVRIGYLFGHPSVAVTDTVSFFAAQLRALGAGDGDGIALDLEVTDGIRPAEVAMWAGLVMAHLAAELGRTPLLYTYRAFAAAGNCAGLGSWPLWISDPDHPAGQPQVPAPWKTWAIHQYGITGAIDRDHASWTSPAAMRAALGRRTAPPPPPPAPALEPDMIIVSVSKSEVPAGTEWPGAFLVTSAGLHHITSTPDLEAYQAAGIKGPVTISWAEYQAWTAAR